MALLAQLNPLRFYENKLSRQFENTENEHRLVTYKMFVDGQDTKCEVPPFSLIINSTDQGSVTNFEMFVYDCEGNEIFTSTTYSASNFGNYTQVTFAGSEVENDIEGNYEIKIVITSTDNGTETFYSDFFQWTDKLSDKLKISAESSKIRLGEYQYEMINILHEFYLDIKPLTSGTYLKEEANETYAITNTNSGSSALLRSFLIKGNEPIFMFLRALRIFSCNGSVIFTWRLIDYLAADITTEIETDLVNFDLMNIKIEFKVFAEVASVYNG